MPVGDSVSCTTTTSGVGRHSRSRSYPTQAARGPVSPSGSANTRSPNSSAPARSASSVEPAGRLPTRSSSLLTRLIPGPSSLGLYAFEHRSYGPAKPPATLRSNDGGDRDGDEQQRQVEE